MRHPGLKENIALWMPYILTGSYCHIYVNKLRVKNTLKVFRVNVVKKKKRSVTIYTEVWVMSEMKIHPNSQTTLGLQNHWAVPGAANDIKAKVSSEKFYSNLFCTWIHNSQQCYIYRRWLRAKIRSFAVFVWPNCRKTADEKSCKISNRLYPLPVMDEAGKISHPAVTQKLREISHISAHTAQEGVVMVPCCAPFSFQVPLEEAACGDFCSQWWGLGLLPAARCSQRTGL